MVYERKNGNIEWYFLNMINTKMLHELGGGR